MDCPLRISKATLVPLVILFYSAVSGAIEDDQIPDVLKPWKEWVLYDHPDHFCPVATTGKGQTFCVWPSQLDLTVNETEAVFLQRWTVYAKSWVMLPGGQALWPDEVKANQRVVPVTVRSGRPGTFLEPGEYVVSGKIRWKTRPEFLSIPIHTAIVSLKLDGKQVTQNNISSDGKLWFGRTGRAKPKIDVIDTVKVQVFRKLKDGNPMTIETELRLAISGRDRELRFGRLLPDGSLPVRFHSPLPARLDPDGQLRIQARAGEWVIHLSSRYTESVAEFQMLQMGDNWPEKEIWVFEANRSLRTVAVEGARALDPQQTLLPDKWKNFPVYLIEPSTHLKLEEQHRGDVGIAGNQLVLDRVFWLDFDGEGYTIRDHITGRLSQGWRMSMQPGNDLGRVDLNGKPQLVTRMGDDGQRGVEVRQGNMNLTAVSRYEGQVNNISPVGWNHDIANLNVTLNLPPGWELLYARGVDTAHGSWIQKWNLWNLFLVLIISVSLGRVIHPVWGFVAGVALVIMFHEPYAPKYIWLNLAATLALLKAMPDGLMKRSMRVYHLISLIALVLMALTFGVDQAKKGLFPQLDTTGMMGAVAPAQVKSLLSADSGANLEMQSLRESEPSFMGRGQRISKLKKPGLKLDYKASIQTGPGQPAWTWKTVRLIWNGPMTKNQKMKLALIPPPVTRCLHFLRVILLFLIIGIIFLFTFGGSKRWPRLKKIWLPGTLMTFLLPLCLVLCAAPTSADEGVPAAHVLKQLEQRLTEPPAEPANATSITRGYLQIAERKVLFRLKIHAAAHSAIPLPGHRDQWLPETVEVDGARAIARHDYSGQLLISLPRGVHEVILQGIAVGDDLRFPVITPAHNLEVDAPGWHVSGLIDGQTPGRSIHLTRVDKARKKPDDVLLPDPIQPFVYVERTLNLGMEWHVHTRVVRAAPKTTAINLRIPTLTNALVVTSGIKQENGTVQVVMQPGQTVFEWDSLLQIKDEIVLHAVKEQSSWAEQWALHCSTIWHFEHEGITPIKQSVGEGIVNPTWKPWPGETLVIRLSRPEAVEGRTRTIENINLVSRPGRRVTDNELTLTIRASQGGDYLFQIDAGSRIQSLEVDGLEQMISEESGEVKVPLNPGVQTIALMWQEDRGIERLTKTPQVDFKEPVSNINLVIWLPENRWLLFAGGPTLGPAVLYWGVFAVSILLAIGLSRNRSVPLKVHHWLLLLIGLSTVNAIGGVPVVLWLILMAERKARAGGLSPIRFNFVQILMVLFSIAAIISLLATIPMSLLSDPHMQIVGNGSYSSYLSWYHDRSVATLPTAWVVTAPIWTYRLAMLFWSLWMVFALTSWIKWGWHCFSEGGRWKKRVKKQKATPPPIPTA